MAEITRGIITALLLSMLGEWQTADADCRTKLCGEPGGIKWENCPKAKEGEGQVKNGSRVYEPVMCRENGQIHEHIFTEKTLQWYIAPDDVKYLAITEIDIPDGVVVSIAQLADPGDNKCKILKLNAEANTTEKVIIKLLSPKGKFKITASQPTATIKFICNRERECTKMKSSSLMKRIVRGKEATPHEFPFVVRLQAIYSTKAPTDFESLTFQSLEQIEKDCCDGEPIAYVHCGGSIISKEGILTAAHCVPSTRKEDHQGQEKILNLVGVLIKLGEHKVDEPDIGEIERWVKPSKVTRHDKFDYELKDYDIAVLRLERAITLVKEKYYPICLAPANMSPLEGCEVQTAGWGITDNKQPSKVLMKGTFKIVNDECTETGIERKEKRDKAICFADDNTNACKRDSGGPVFCDSANDFYYQVGIMSYSGTRHPTDIWEKGSPQGAADVVGLLTWINGQDLNLP